MTRPDKQRALWLAEQVLPHEPALRGWLARRLPGRVGTRLEVGDVVQETYAVLATLEDVAAIRNPRAYMFAVAQSVILQHVRRARIVSIETVAEMDRLDIAHDQLSPDRYVAAREELRHVGRLIAALPDKCRQAFVLRKVHGLPQREIARRMRISESTVEKHIGKGVRLLAQAMGRGDDSRVGTEALQAGRKGGRHDKAST